MSPYIFIRVGVRPRSAWVTLMQPGRCKATRQCNKFGPKVEIWAMESNVVGDAVCMGRFIMFFDLLPASVLHGASVFICEDISVVGGCSGVHLSLRWQPAETWTPWDVERVNQMLVSQKTSVCSLPPWRTAAERHQTKTQCSGYRPWFIQMWTSKHIDAYLYAYQ